jgi:DNA-binding MltR family transcriptional regulator
MSKKPIIPAESLTKEADELYKTLENESDLEVVVIGAAFLDVCLKALLSRFLIEGETSGALLQKGPLNEFAVRAKIAYALGLISKLAFRDLVCIAEIRNAFAHHHRVMSFDFSEVGEQCRKLYCGKSIIDDLAIDKALILPRTRFTVSVVLLSQRLMIDCLGLQRRPTPTESFDLPPESSQAHAKS